MTLNSYMTKMVYCRYYYFKIDYNIFSQIMVLYINVDCGIMLTNLYINSGYGIMLNNLLLYVEGLFVLIAALISNADTFFVVS